MAPRKFLGYFEWFYRSQGSDVGFGNDSPPSPDTCLRVHTYNSPIVMDLAQSDAAICPTRWQAQQFPAVMRNHLHVIFDGIDTERLPLIAPESRMGGLTLQAGDQQVEIPERAPLVTYVTRCFEPYRGWPQVAEGLSRLMQRNPRAHILQGSDDVATAPNERWTQGQWAIRSGRWIQIGHMMPAGLRRLCLRNPTQLGACTGLCPSFSAGA